MTSLRWVIVLSIFKSKISERFLKNGQREKSLNCSFAQNLSPMSPHIAIVSYFSTGAYDTNTIDEDKLLSAILTEIGVSHEIHAWSDPKVDWSSFSHLLIKSTWDYFDYYPQFLQWIEKVKALADAFRPYGIKVFLTARFSSPIELGRLKTADPMDATVQQWWTAKANEIYSLIPDFGGFLVKANSEGQPGPQDYKRTHADGANMLAAAVAPHKGIVIWRAFVYAAENPVDRHMQANDDFVPLDGKFNSNVMVQVKNGAIDFMPREPFHPLFGAMPKTPLMMEFQVTQEYLGQATNWVFLAPLFKEVLDSDTYAKGKGSTIAKVIDGSLDDHALNGMTGVANIGNDINWTGHPMAQANWF